MEHNNRMRSFLPDDTKSLLEATPCSQTYLDAIKTALSSGLLFRLSPLQASAAHDVALRLGLLEQVS